MTKISKQLIEAAQKWVNHEGNLRLGYSEKEWELKEQAKQAFIELAQSIEKHIDLAEALAVKNAECADYWKEQHKLMKELDELHLKRYKQIHSCEDSERIAELRKELGFLNED